MGSRDRDKFFFYHFFFSPKGLDEVFLLMGRIINFFVVCVDLADFWDLENSVEKIINLFVPLCWIFF